ASRLNLSIADISFRCLFLDKNWSALTHEKPLIERFNYTWNATGFGNHDPGRNRDKTELKPNHFDRLYPIDADYEVQFTPGTHTVASAIQVVKSSIPYLFRHQ